jgi:hypothetical protein
MTNADASTMSMGRASPTSSHRPAVTSSSELQYFCDIKQKETHPRPRVRAAPDCRLGLKDTKEREYCARRQTKMAYFLVDRDNDRRGVTALISQ